MMTLDELRALLGDLAAGKTDQELAQLRESVYEWARAACAAYVATARAGAEPARTA